MSASASRRDNTDRSLARSAWESVPSKEPSRRVRYDRTQRIPEVLLVDLCAVFQFWYSKFRHSNHPIGAHTCTNHTVPYGTALLGGAVPGTSCQATIAPSLQDAFSPAPDQRCKKQTLRLYLTKYRQ